MSTVYVASTGNDSNTYAQAQSSATPWLTLGKCNTSATTGDTIIVMAGTLTIASVTFTKSFTIQGATSSPTLYILDGGNVRVTFTINASITIIWKYLTIQNINLNSGGNTGLFYYGGALAVSDVENCIISGLTLSDDNGSMFMNVSSYASCSMILNNTLVKNLVGVAAKNIQSIFFVFQSALNSIVTITSSTIYLNSTLNNIDNILYADSSATGTYTIKNSIIYVSGSTVNIQTGATGITKTYSYSDLYGLTGTTTGTGVITSDPLFVDAANGNFNLRPTSGCADSGSAT